MKLLEYDKSLLLYKVTKPFNLNTRQFEPNELVEVKELHLVVGGTSLIYFMDRQGYYHMLSAKTFKERFVHDKTEEVIE